MSAFAPVMQNAKRFYLGMNYNLPGRPGAGAALARDLIRGLEAITRCRCTSSWPFEEPHSWPGFGRSAAVQDLVDLSLADFMIAVPLTGTSRGTHVEIGAALALGKPVYLYATDGRDPTGFDSLCYELPPGWRSVIEATWTKED